MQTIAFRPLLLAASALILAPAFQAAAEVTRAEITSRADVQNGAAFGDAGAYELLTGRISSPSIPRMCATR